MSRGPFKHRKTSPNFIQLFTDLYFYFYLFIFLSRLPRFFPWRRRPGRGTGTSRGRTPGTGNHPGRRPPGQPSVYPCRLPVGPGALNRRPTRGSRTRAPPPRPALCWGSAPPPPPPPAPFPPPTGVLASSPKGSLPDLGVGIFHTRRSARIFLR